MRRGIYHNFLFLQQSSWQSILRPLDKRIIILFFLCFFSNAYCQTKWKKFNSKPDNYSLLLPARFELGPRMSQGIIQWFTDTTSYVQIWDETSPNSNQLSTLFKEHKESFSSISKEELNLKSFIIEGEESIVLDGKGYFFEKCILIGETYCILRILYSEEDKSFMDIPKISKSFKEIKK